MASPLRNEQESVDSPQNASAETGNHSGLLLFRHTMTMRSWLVANSILGVVKSYPKMLLDGGRLPPFIHFHISVDGINLQHDDVASKTFLPEPLAICASLAQLYKSKNRGSSAFVRRTIYLELQRLYSEVCGGSHSLTSRP